MPTTPKPLSTDSVYALYALRSGSGTARTSETKQLVARGLAVFSHTVQCNMKVWKLTDAGKALVPGLNITAGGLTLTEVSA
jgi:hypothetical protein